MRSVPTCRMAEAPMLPTRTRDSSLNVGIAHPRRPRDSTLNVGTTKTRTPDSTLNVEIAAVHAIDTGPVSPDAPHDRTVMLPTGVRNTHVQ